MGFFPDTIAASLAGRKVQCAPLVLFDFTSGPVRLWRGLDDLVTADGHVWRGIGTLGGISGIEQAINGQAPQATFVLSGIDAPIWRLAKEEFTAEALGRTAYLMIQFFGVDDPADPDNQRVLDAPFPCWAGRCLTPTFTFEASSGARSVSIAAESLFSLRSRPQYAMYTDADQQHRFAGDLGFEFVGTLVNKKVTWPDY